jgi:hypothetical protein
VERLQESRIRSPWKPRLPYCECLFGINLLLKEPYHDACILGYRSCENKCAPSVEISLGLLVRIRSRRKPRLPYCECLLGIIFVSKEPYPDACILGYRSSENKCAPSVEISLVLLVTKQDTNSMESFEWDCISPDCISP